MQVVCHPHLSFNVSRVFLIAPITTAMVCLMSRTEEPWRITALVWAILIFITFCIWAFAVTYEEIKSCFMLVERCFPTEENEPNRLTRFVKTANRALLITQTKRYSGVRSQRYLVAGDEPSRNYTESELAPAESRTGCFSRFISLPCCSLLFVPVDRPERIFKADEIRGIQPIMTKNNWSMQKYWCYGDSHQNTVLVTGGSSALSNEQMKYSVLCTFTGIIFATLLLIGFFVWLELGVAIYLLAAIIALLCCVYPLFWNSREMIKMYNQLKEDNIDEEDNERDTATMVNIWETAVITTPKTWLCYAFVLFEMVFFFLWPFISMILMQNYNVAAVFFVLGFFNFLSRFFDASAMLSKHGSISSDLFTEESGGDNHHVSSYRLSEIVGGIINNKGRWVWTWIFVLVFLLVWFMVSASQGSADYVTAEQRGPRPPILLVNDFYYAGVNNLAYPTCKLTKGFEFPGVDSLNSQTVGIVSSDLGDYSFLSAMAYEKSIVNNYTLKEWFGEGEVIDEVEYVSQWRIDSSTEESPVYFKLFSVPKVNSAVVSIRGSETMFDWLANAHLWFASGTAQLVKWLTPFGWSKYFLFVIVMSSLLHLYLTEGLFILSFTLSMEPNYPRSSSGCKWSY